MTPTSLTSSMRPYQSYPLYMSIREDQHVTRIAARGKCVGVGRTDEGPTDSLLRILRSLENDGATPFGAAVCSYVNVRADDVARGAEQILKVLPSRLIRELRGTSGGQRAERRDTHVSDVKLITRILLRRPAAPRVVVGRTRGRLGIEALPCHCHPNLTWHWSCTEACLCFAVLLAC